MLDIVLGVICLVAGVIIFLSSLPVLPRLVLCVALILITKFISDKFGGGMPE